MKNRPLRAPFTVLTASAAMVLAIIVAVTAVKPFPEQIPEGPSPLGYTKSLALFFVPMACLSAWFVRHPLDSRLRKAFWLTLALLVPIGVILDILLATTLFRFEHPTTHLGICIPALGNECVPVEELVFYLTGFITTLLLYVWADEDWLVLYNVSDYEQAALKARPVVSFDGRALPWGLAACVASILIKRHYFAQDGWPTYTLFLIIAALLPTLGLLRSTLPVINWRALLLTCLVMLLISLVWEVTLALPFGWWNYHHDHMLGLFVRPWNNLPIEAIFVWFAVTYMTVVVFEALKLYLHLETKKTPSS